MHDDWRAWAARVGGARGPRARARVSGARGRGARAGRAGARGRRGGHRNLGKAELISFSMNGMYSILSVRI